ncbi:MAG: 50S ribosomal protein L18e [archaeon]|jgi:large subunit ribosomal protein L18e
MAKKLETIKLVASLEKAARKTNKEMWADLAERLAAPSRNKVAVNIKKIDLLAKKFKGKILLVPGKVLSEGELNEKVTVVAIAASAGAKEKINAKGKLISLIDFAKDAAKVELKNVMIVK